MPVVIPLHPRTRGMLSRLGLEPAGVLVAEPLPYRTFLSLQCGAAAVLTDSGGVQEETTALGIRCFTLRDNTERPITITSGSNVLLGLDPDRIATIPSLLGETLDLGVPPLWDGRAGVRAAAAIERALAAEAAAAA